MDLQLENSEHGRAFEIGLRLAHMQYPSPAKRNHQEERWNWPWMIGWGYYSKEKILAETAGKKVTHLKITSPMCMELIKKWAPDVTHLRLSNPSDADLEQVIKIFSKVKSLKALDLGGNHFSKGLPESVCRIKSLTDLNLVSCGLRDLPASLPKHLPNLEALNLAKNRFCCIPSCIKKLKKLKILKMDRCLADSSDSGFTVLSGHKHLACLDVGGNDYSAGLPSSLLGLSHIKELRLRKCNLKNNPAQRKCYDKFEQLTNVESISLSWNDFSTYGIPEQVFRLQTLRSLKLGHCNLQQLPASLSSMKQLKELKLDGNPLRRLPIVICGLQMLEHLNISDCLLDELPQSFSLLENLRDLDIGGSKNRFKSLPNVILQLNKLECLNLASLGLMKSLDRRILNLSNLTTLICWNCFALESPPSQVCAQGLFAIKKYYNDLAQHDKPSAAAIPVTSIAVIGSTMAGKTSLIETLKNKRRILTNRDENSPTDETTEVFDVKDITIGDSKLRCFDFGGNDVYHLAHQFTIRNNYIPVIVVNMKQYSDLSMSAGSNQATKMVCLNFMSHLYISCPKLGAPILVLTHMDCLSKAEFTEGKEQLLSTMESLRKTMVEEEARFSKNTSRFCKIEHFSNTDIPLFKSEDIYIFSNAPAETENILSLTMKLKGRSKIHEKVIPDIWNNIESFFELNHQLPFILLQAVLDAFPDDKDSVILRYKHDVGRVLWFELDIQLRQFVFHRMDLLTSVISLLFHHRNAENWRKRVDGFKPFHFKDKWVTKEKFGELVNKFLRSGVLDEVILYTAFSEREFPVQTAIALLRTFHLVCGPVRATPREAYIIPALSEDTIEETNISDSLLPLRVAIIFIGLPPPPYVYHLLTVAFLNLFPSHEFGIRAASNGAVVHHGASISRVTHNSVISELTVQVDTPVEELDASWRLMKKVIHHILRCSLTNWEGARPICKFFCSHCLLLRLPNPDVDLDPDWMEIPTVNDSAENESEWISEFRGAEPVPCCNDRTNGGPLTVLKPLRYPCDSLTAEELQKVEVYVAKLSEDRTNSNEAEVAVATANTLPVSSNPASITQTGAEVPSAETAKTEMDYVEEIVAMMKICHADISLPSSQESLVTTTRNAPDKEYEMTEPLGRALIISNKYLVTDHRTGSDHWRHGSEHDYTNMRQMLNRLNFITAGEHKNYTAKNMVDAIHEETQLIDEYTGRSIHEGFGMFVLILTSHGNDGSILGCDYMHIKLTDIYDLLSARNFPAMKGKPKLIIIQACSGEKVEMMLDGVPEQPIPRSGSSTSGSNAEIGLQSAEEIALTAVQSHNQQTQQPEEFDLDPQNTNISVADLLIMQSSFDSFASPRSPVLGSPFIRAVVLTFYKMASQYDVGSMSDVVREAVSLYSAERSNEIMQSCPPSERHRAFIAQMPKSICTFTGLRKLYLRSSDLSDQTQSQAQDETESDEITRIQWLSDMVTEWRTEGVRSGARFLRWKVERVPAGNSSAGPA